MKYCFIDESGTASRKDKRPFIVALVIFDSIEEVYMMQEKIGNFRAKNNIAKDYEFHYSRNTKTKKEKFIVFIRKNVKQYKIFKITEKDDRNTYAEIAEMITGLLSKEEKYNIRLDDNPQFFKALRIALREKRIVAKITQEESRKNELIQIADYLAGLASEKG